MIQAIVILGGLVAALFGFAATRPGTFRVERRTSIEAPPEKIFPLINDFRSWTAWSPYEKLDPAMTRTYSGAESGTGAVYEWAGNSKAGAGRMEITDTAPPARITIKLDFYKPFKAHNISEFSLEPRGDSTEVTWSTHGPNLFVSKVMGIFVDMDNLIGRDFESGLANLKAVAEA